MPYPNTMKRITEKAYPEADPNIHLPLKQDVSLLPNEVIRHIMIDEIKLKNSIAYNASNYKVKRFSQNN